MIVSSARVDLSKNSDERAYYPRANKQKNSVLHFQRNVQVFSVGGVPVALYLFHPVLFPDPLVLLDVVSVLGEHPDKRGS